MSARSPAPPCRPRRSSFDDAVASRVGSRWAFLAAKSTNHTWLNGFAPSVYGSVTDHIPGKECAELVAELPTDETADDSSAAPRPSWAPVLCYERQLRKAAFRRARSERVTITVATTEVIDGAELGKPYFTSLAALLPRQAKREGERPEDGSWPPKARRANGAEGPKG